MRNTVRPPLAPAIGVVVTFCRTNDGDFLPDGMERMLGMNSLSPDSDCDGKSDEAELPLTQLQPAGHDPLLPNLCP